MIKQLQSAVNKFIRIIFGLNARDSVKDVMQKHGIFFYKSVRIRNGQFYVKYLHSDLFETFQNLLGDNYLHGSNSRQEVSLNFSLAFAASN